LADDLAQQIFFQAWRSISQLRRADGFGPWLKRLAIRTWLQHFRKNDVLRQADEFEDGSDLHQGEIGIGMDLDRALAILPGHVRLCVVLSYHEGMTHAEIADLLGLPAGTVKSHIRRGAQKLQQILADYQATDTRKESP